MWCPVTEILPGSRQPKWILLFAMGLVLVVRTGLALPLPSTTLNDFSIAANELDTTDRLEGSMTSTELTTTTTTTTTEKIPVFNRRRVSLEVASDLFSSSTSLALGLSNMLGDVVRRTSVRIAQLVRLFQPLFGYHLMIDVPKELDT
ncbi:uncharacterized protein LOC126571190 [Anopheles aquasalis]|uniref:uncharacterized protein LOC126571190 n=1 Tax=Anopheles aquasalis TaxID=42839 RepID=UPI00215AF239|nr:uncharacterized protein LOC126571190 [Anopheles aquasalis]